MHKYDINGLIFLCLINVALNMVTLLTMLMMR